ncbi:unnamed protein product, partial [marine sediment metagenome]
MPIKSGTTPKNAAIKAEKGLLKLGKHIFKGFLL